MCVTNTTGRRYQPISFSASQLSLLQKPVLPDGPLTSLPSSVQSVLASVETIETCQSNQSDKIIPKRRRKPQKPGKTAKNNDRHFVVHHYHDHALDVDNGDSSSHHTGDESSSEECHRRRGGVSVAFPVKLHEVLDQVEADGYAHIISWQSHGRCFMIHKPKEFVDYIMPRYFRQTKLTSFQRQLNLYGFNRITRGADSGAYYSEYFLRWRVFLCKHMIRTKVKGTRFKAASNPEHEPDFYTMPIVAPLVSDSSSVCDMSQTSSSSTDTYAPIPIPQQTFSLDTISYAGAAPDMAYLPSSLNQFLSPYYKTEPLPLSPVAVDVEVNNENFFDVNDQDALDNMPLDWDESFDSAFEMSLKDDIQLGYMLDKLLED